MLQAYEWIASTQASRVDFEKNYFTEQFSDQNI